MIVVDDEIELRWPTLDDLQALFDLVDANRKYLERWLPWVPGVHTPVDERPWIEHHLKAQEADGSNPPLIVYQGKIVGAVGMNYPDPINKATEIGYWQAEDYQGLGIMTRSCKAVLKYLFTELGFNRVQIRVDPTNHRSAAIPTRLGFQLEGIQRQAGLAGGSFVDLAVYSLLAEEWNR